MARPPRIDFPDALYHVTSRGNGRQEIFWTGRDRERFLGQLADGVQSEGGKGVRNRFGLPAVTCRSRRNKA